LIGLVAGEFFGSLFDDCFFVEGLDACHGCFVGVCSIG
jgi:hypothetical protein